MVQHNGNVPLMKINIKNELVHIMSNNLIAIIKPFSLDTSPGDNTITLVSQINILTEPLQVMQALNLWRIKSISIIFPALPALWLLPEGILLTLTRKRKLQKKDMLPNNLSTLMMCKTNMLFVILGEVCSQTSNCCRAERGKIWKEIKSNLKLCFECTIAGCLNFQFKK